MYVKNHRPTPINRSEAAFLHRAKTSRGALVAAAVQSTAQRGVRHAVLHPKPTDGA
jgi:hypothetical protein